jgi:DNA-binding winged helix-turn-helix (wHTH) protein
MLYKFNAIELDTENFQIKTNGEETPVEPQVFNLIVLLIHNKDRIVSRDEILDSVWKDRVVSDTSINNHIKSARKVLGDDGIKQQVIKTIHSRGYQFIAKTNVDSEPSAREITRETTFKPKRFKSSILTLSIVLVGLFVFMKYYQHTVLTRAVQNIANYQELSYVTFIAQAKRRNELVEMIEQRIGEERDMQYEKYFSYYFDKLDKQEKFVFEQIRAMTGIGLYQNNRKIVDELNKHPKIFKLIKGTKELHKHLSFWINKYHSVFKQRQDMCLLYVGVEDGVPYPADVNKNVKDWLLNNKSN